MAIYHLSVKTISRSAGRSATASAAYRFGMEILDERTGDVHDYRRKGGVESATMVLSDNAPTWASDRSALWNAAEQSETRKNSTVAREFVVALPAELPPEARRRLAEDFARAIVERHGCAADVAVHAPNREGDDRNHHAHILCSTRRLAAEGFGEKTRELDDRKSGEVERWRERWAELTNARLREAGCEARIDHRSLEAQAADRMPTAHLGPAATAMERRGERTRLGDHNRAVIEDATARLYAAKELGEIHRQIAALEGQLIDLSSDLAKARAERDQGRAVSPSSPTRKLPPPPAGFGAAVAQALAARGEPKPPAAQAPEKAPLPHILEPLAKAGTDAEPKPKSKPQVQPQPHKAPPQPPPEAPLEPREQKEQKEQTAAQVKQRYLDAAQTAAREAKARHHEAEAAAAQARLRRLEASGPGEKPRLFGRKDWERQYTEWAGAKAQARQDYQRHAGLARVHRDGYLDRWDTQAALADGLARFAREQPALQACLDNKAERERQEAKQAQEAKRAVADFQRHALKRCQQARGYRQGDNGLWDALPEPLQRAIEQFNAAPEGHKAVILEQMRQRFQRDPNALKTVQAQLEQGRQGEREMQREGPGLSL